MLEKRFFGESVLWPDFQLHIVNFWSARSDCSHGIWVHNVGWLNPGAARSYFSSIVECFEEPITRRFFLKEPAKHWIPPRRQFNIPFFAAAYSG